MDAGTPGDRAGAQTEGAGRLWSVYAVSALLLVVAVLVPVWLKAADARYHNYDLGIFAQALHRFSLSDPNPFLGALNARIFSEHLDPVFIPFAPLARVLRPDFAALLAEHLLVLLAPLPVVLLARRGRIPISVAWIAIPYLLFNRGMVSALDFPVHPTTWAATFAVAFAAALLSGRLPLVLPAAVLLMACKEEYPFAVLMAGGVLLLGRGRRIGVWLVVSACVWMVLAFVLRPWLTGPTQPYAARILDPLLADPLGLLWKRLADPKPLGRLLELVAPLLPLIVWQVRSRRGWNLPLLAAAVPLLAIRFIDQAWKFHYLAPLGAFAAAALFAGDARQRVPRGVVVLSLVLLAGIAAGPTAKIAAAYGDRLAPTEAQRTRREALSDAAARLRADPAGGIRVAGNLFPGLADLPGIFQLGGVQRSAHGSFRWVLAEKPPAGDPWPLTDAELDAMIGRLRRMKGVRIHRDDEGLLLAEGLFRE